MNSAALAQSAYARATAIAPTERTSEYRAFADITRRLSELSDRENESFPMVADALYRNNRLWSVLLQDVASPTNKLPSDLRAGIFYLAEYSRIHSARVLRKEATVTVLIEINTAVMRGLRTRPEGR